MASYSRTFRHISRAKTAEYRQRRRGCCRCAPLTPDEEARLRWHYYEQEQALEEDARRRAEMER